MQKFHIRYYLWMPRLYFNIYFDLPRLRNQNQEIHLQQVLPIEILLRVNCLLFAFPIVFKGSAMPESDFLIVKALSHRRDTILVSLEVLIYTGPTKDL